MGLFDMGLFDMGLFDMGLWGDSYILHFKVCQGGQSPLAHFFVSVGTVPFDTLFMWQSGRKSSFSIGLGNDSGGGMGVADE